MSLQRGLLEACDDARLLGLELWPRQRSLLAGVEDDRMHVWALGRRSGKTTLAATVGLWDCTMRPHLDEMVRPGETRYAVAVATNMAQARVLVSAARSIVERSPALASLLDSDTEDELRFVLPSGARTALRAFPCNARGARGFPISTLVMDEAAHFLSETDGPAVAERVWNALAPATAQFGEHARVIVSSTPYGPDGLFARLFDEAKGGRLVGAVAQHATTADVNPSITVAFLAAEEARDPISFAAEYRAEFLAAGDSFIDLDRASVGGRGGAPPDAGTGWVAGLDPAFAARGDAFGVALVGRSRLQKDHLIVGEVLALRPEGDFTGALARCADIASLYGARLVTDQYSAAAVLDFLRRRGLHVSQRSMTATSKTNIFGELRARLYERTLELPNHPGLLGELRRLQTRFRAGSAAVTNPRVGGSHGDMAQALALAVFEFSRGGGASVQSRLPRFGEPVIQGGGLTLVGERFLDVTPGGRRVPPAGFEFVNGSGR